MLTIFLDLIFNNIWADLKKLLISLFIEWISKPQMWITFIQIHLLTLIFISFLRIAHKFLGVQDFILLFTCFLSSLSSWQFYFAFKLLFLLFQCYFFLPSWFDRHYSPQDIKDFKLYEVQTIFRQILP